MSNKPASDKYLPMSRRTFLHGLGVLALGTAVEALTGCSSTLTESPTALPPTGTLLPPTATVPSPTTTPSPTATPVPDLPLFDWARLAPVTVAHDPLAEGYPRDLPFDPDSAYPEYPFGNAIAHSTNAAYRLVREALRLFNPAGYGTPGWNPLGRIIQPGDRVLIKPNLVDAGYWQNGQMTHPAFLRPVIDYVYRACGPGGSIMLGDAPWSVEVFPRLVVNTGIQDMVAYLAATHGVPIRLVDLNIAEPQNTPLVDLGTLSELRQVQRTWYDAHGKAMHDGDDPGIGRYRIAPAVLEADVIVNVPKAKVHCSGGITAAMKNMVGLIPAWDGPHGDGALKECAHTSDVDQAGGRRGMYLENDTIWRSMADLNRILLYADAQGTLRATPQRRYVCLVDAITAAEASQYQPQPFSLNTVIIGADPISVDAVTARCMGFDPRQLKSVMQAAVRQELPLGPSTPARIRVITADQQGLNAHFRQALKPETQIYSWEGVLEARDFDPPRILATGWDEHSGTLQVTLHDPSGVSWVRVNYIADGEQRTKDLTLVEGSPVEGLWSVPFPRREALSGATLLASDALFNEMMQEPR
ncbi:MAG: DUF362 domain-containing protein [Anaerolineae bacterium]|jgi:uncharacterized protein (DUF362 family)|nr:DUF362 domain-containing protein [Anaerolineae bacterium]